MTELESRSADLLAKEAARFVTSGTMGNQIGVKTLAERGEEVIVGDATYLRYGKWRTGRLVSSPDQSHSSTGWNI